MKNMKDLFHPVMAFAIVAVVAFALKGGAEWRDFVCALAGVVAAEAALF